MFSVIIVIIIIIIIIIVIIISIVIIIITGKKELACYFNSYLFHSVVPDIQEHYFETTVCTLILEQLYRKTVTRPLDIYNVNFEYTNKIQVEKVLHNINTRKACGHEIRFSKLLKDLRCLVHYHY